MIPGGAALANAVADATGVRITTLPITPARAECCGERPRWSALQPYAENHSHVGTGRADQDD